MENTSKTQLFEQTPIPRAVMTLAIPTVISSLVMVIYNLADTYFVGMLNNPSRHPCRAGSFGLQRSEQSLWRWLFQYDESGPGTKRL